MNFFKKIWNYLQHSGFYRVLNFISKSAIIGLMITLILFFIEWVNGSKQEKETRQQLNTTLEGLSTIEQSLSTRFLGIFPGYISNICDLFYNIQEGDTVIVFEDVLYYGIKSRPEEFRRYNHQLIKHALNGGHVLVAYYNHELDSTLGKPVWENIFHKMVMESRIDPTFLAEMAVERRNTLRSAGTSRSWEARVATDSALCEQFFAKSKKAYPKKFKKDIASYLDSSLITGIGSSETKDTAVAIVERMCLRIDSLKHACLDKDINEVTFADYERMYRGMSEIIAYTYLHSGVELLPLDDYLTMSCWLVKPGVEGYERPSEAILAFPSKYSSDEIGFYSQANAFSDYISTMQKGVKDERKSRYVMH